MESKIKIDKQQKIFISIKQIKIKINLNVTINEKIIIYRKIKIKS